MPQAALDDRQRLACLRLVRSENVGPATFRDLINHYGGATAALEALPEISRRAGRAIRICRKDAAEAELARARKAGVELVFTIEPHYPPALAHLDLPPPLIHAKGRLDLLSQPGVAIVGSRQASAAGRKMAQLLASGLGEAGFVVVSGLARGIDAVAHQAALPSGTVAVLAGGIDNIYPPEHAALHAEIAERGCLVSEQPLGFAPRGQDFPRRNRIISGISLGVVVVEAARRSGSLITARIAGEQGREVFAVPGHPLDPRAEGTNRLLKDGASIATTASDVIEGLTGLADSRPTPLGETGMALREAPANGPPLADDATREAVLSALGPAPVTIDDIVRATGCDARVVQAALLELSLAGLIERHGHQLISQSVT